MSERAHAQQVFDVLARGKQEAGAFVAAEHKEKSLVKLADLELLSVDGVDAELLRSSTGDLSQLELLDDQSEKDSLNSADSTSITRWI